MYSNTHIYVNFFTNPKATNTDKVTYGRVSEGIKTGRKDDAGREIYEFESYNARFVGKAREKALSLTDKARITLTEWAVRNPYNKERKRSYPYLMIMDFEIQEQAAADEQEACPDKDQFDLLEDDDSELPF